MAIYTTEIASDKIQSDNPVHQRLLKAYVVAREMIGGNLLEVGCGEGRGVKLFREKTNDYLALDKIPAVIERLQSDYPDVRFKVAQVPPFAGVPDNHFDWVVAFQVIEHIQNDRGFLAEIYRVLKPGGKAMLTTPNRIRSLTRNPWHIREYTAPELSGLAQSVFDEVVLQGITGNSKVMQYYEENRKSVEKITRFDIFNLQYRLPRSILRIPYEILNRFNRNKLQSGNQQLVGSITENDYLVTDQPQDALDLLLIAGKKA